MRHTSWAEVKSLFQAARLSPDSQRTALLRDADAPDARRAEVARLLACAEAMGGFLDTPAASRASASRAWAPGDRVSGRYRIIRRIGGGGMGDVYEAEDLELRACVALKTIRAELAEDARVLERFRREVMLARRIAHPSVCRIFDFGRHDSADVSGDASSDATSDLSGSAGSDRQGVYLSMELLPGETLEARIQRTGPLEYREAAAITAQLCAGLDAAHDAGVLHRDLKTSNVMLVPHGDAPPRAVIMDFGLACPLTGSAPPAITLTNTGDCPGTPQYMAPEQVSGGDVGSAADVYALGVVIHRMLTGHYPFEGGDRLHDMVRRLTDDPTPPRTWRPDVPARWEEVVRRCLMREPALRPPNGRAVLAMLEGRPDRARRRWALAVVVAAAFLGSAGTERSRAREPLPDEKRVVVLPLTPDDAREPALADGVSESVSARLDDLRTFDPRLSNVPFADVRAAGTTTIEDARRAFGVNLAVTGTLHREGEALDLDLRLVDAATGRALRQQRARITGEPRALAGAIVALLDLSPEAAALARLDGSAPGSAVVPPDAYAFYEQGKGYLLRSGERDADTAIVLLRRALASQPAFALAQAALARAHAKQFQRTQDMSSADLAERAAAAALAIDPGLSAAYVARGMVLRQLGRRNDAVTAFLAALRLDGADADALNQLANTYDELGDPLRAEATFERAIRANTGYWGGYNNLGRFYLRHGQIDEAARQFRTATSLAPDNPRAHSNLGGVYLMLGRHADAQTALQRAYDLQPTAAICSNLGTAALALDRTARAIALFEQAVTLAPRDHRYIRNLGDAYERAGRLDDARGAWTKAADLAEHGLRTVGSPTSDQWATAALYRAKLRDGERARRWLASARRVARADEPGVQLKIAQALELIGERREAIDTLARAKGAGLAAAEIEQSAELAALRRDPRYAARAAAR